MAEIIRVSGTRVTTPQGPTTIGSPNGTITIDSTNTNVTGDTTFSSNVAIKGGLKVGGIANFNNQAQSTGTNSGAVQVMGGVGIGGNINVGGNTVISGTIAVVGNTSTMIILSTNTNVGNPFGIPYNPNDIYDTFEHRSTASVYIAGGVGIEKDLNVGGFIYGRVAQANTSLQQVITATNIDATFYPIFAKVPTGFSYSYSDPVSATTGSQGLTYNPYYGKLTVERLSVESTETSTSPTTGAFTVTGGAGILGDLHVGDAGYIDHLYTKIIESTAGPIRINPAANNVTEIVGDIRVLGQKPIGTAPVVTNVLYVTMDGDDTNDGRALDPSRACRTIGGAMKSPYYQPGTQIQVSAGHYFEDNPLEMKPYTSVMGSDIRTTAIEPINKTQDLFHVQSGCYLAFMQFCNGRSGLLDGQYDPGFNRGAYCTAFPPLTGDDRIDLYHSPYIQNCTNLSGPWLKDGTLFTPNQTVQVPLAVGMGTWPANTSSIVVSVSQGEILRGMAINAGQQNPGFFDARTLMLANKAFLQEQVVNYVDQTFNSGSFTYDSGKCARDTGLIVDSIALDMLYKSNSESTFAGLQYWNQADYTGLITEEITQTIDSLTYAKSLAVALANSAGGSTPAGTVGDNFDTILNILSVGTTGVTDIIVSNGLTQTDANIVAAYNALLGGITSIADQTLAWLDTNYPGFEFDRATCRRDIGYIIKSVAFDLLHTGNKQSVKAGVYYYGFNAESTAIPNEIPQTTAAYNFIKSIISDIVLGIEITAPYQNLVTQEIIGYLPGTAYEVETLKNKIDVITNIIRNGPSVAEAKQPINLVPSGSSAVAQAYDILIANKEFIKAEVIAYIDQTQNNFEYSREKCARDVAILVENAAYDMAFGGNEKSVESGLGYFNGVVSRIAGQETQTGAAIDYLSELCKKIVVNETCPVIAPSTKPQVKNIVLTGGAVAVDSLERLFNIITNIIQNGPSVAPEQYRSTGPDAAYVSAEILMQANRAFIQEDTINWINNTFMQFPYSKRKCRRDTGLIIDSVAFDLLYPTEGFSQSTFAGLQYWSQGGYVGTIEDELNPTIDAVTYLKDLSIKIIQNITPADDLINRYQTTATQVTSLEPATSSEVAIISGHFDHIISILGGNSDGWTDRIVPNKDFSNLLSIQNAYNLLLANKEYMAAEVTAYIDANNLGFVYDKVKCQRDVGYMVDAVAFDLLHEGNRQSIQIGLYYYGFDTSATTIRAQEIQTTAAFNYLGTLLADVVQNNPVTPLQTKVAQNTSLQPADSSVVAEINKAIFTITNIITNGPSVDYNATAIAMTATSSATIALAFDIIYANKEFLVEEVIAYIDNTYNKTPFTYDSVKCARDTGLIVDSISLDLLYNTNSESIFAGLQYWNQDGYTGQIGIEVTTTTAAINYAKTQAVNIANIAGTFAIGTELGGLFDIVTGIIVGGTAGITDTIVSNGEITTDANYLDAYNAVIAAKADIQMATVEWINSTYPSFMYNTSTCYRDVGFIIDSVCFDLIHGGNKQSIKSGVYYYGYDETSTDIPGEIEEVTAAYSFIKDIMFNIVKGVPLLRTFQTATTQTIFLDPASDDEVAALEDKLSIITDIIVSGPSVAPDKIPMNLTRSSSTNVENAYNLLLANKDFIVAETIAFIDATFKKQSFTYNEELCYRDTGLIIDAVSQDILLGGNTKSIEAGLAYWNFGYNHVAGQETTTTMALNYARDLALKVIANTPVIPQTQTETTQVINPFFQYGGDYMPQQSVRRNFNIITTIIERGPEYAPPVYQGGGVQALTGINGLDVLAAPTVTSVREIDTGTYVVGLSTATVGFGTNATLYFGDTLVFPYQDNEVADISLEYTGSTSTWDTRKVDPIGGMGGSLVDGAVISARSPIQSFVYDAFTQLTQGGHGVKITNDGYAQLVSVFTIFSSVGVQVDNGGIASIVNSNANFGDICLLAKGYGKRKFTGTLYNPPFKAYPDSPGPEGFNQYYPEGFWPNNAQVQVFTPDVDDRPHISLVMEVEPPAGHVNEQALPGFLNATPSLATLATGTITITGIDTTGIAIGDTVYIRDEAGEQYESNQFLLDAFGNETATPNPNYGRWYAQTGTVVTDLGYQSVTLSNALTHGGGDPENANYFTLLFCGNAYYTVLSSTVANNPKPEGLNILSTASTGGEISQIPIHIESLKYLNSLTNLVIANTPAPSLQGTSTQAILPLVLGGAQASTFIDLRFDEMERIIAAPNVTAAEAVIPPKLRTKTGPDVQGASAAITLIEANIDFLADEVVAYVNANPPPSAFTFDETLCRRDSGYIIDNVAYDMVLGTNYNSIVSGFAYRRGVASSQSVIENELVQTLTAINYIKDQAATVVDFNSTALTRSEAGYSEVMDIIENGIVNQDAYVFPSPSGVDPNKVYAKDLLIANRDFLKAEVVAWIGEQIDSSTPPFAGFTYDSATCARDVGYMVDALCYDILYGGNSASVVAAEAYYSNAALVLTVGEESPTNAAIQHLSDVAQQVILKTTVTPSSGNTVAQNTSGSAASATEAAEVDSLLTIIRNAILIGLGSIPAKVYPDITWADANLQTAFNQIATFKDTIIDSMILYVYDEFSGTFTFDTEKCRRDVKITLQRLIYDLETGGRYNSVMVGLSYWARYGTHHIVSLGENVRRTDLFPDGATVNFYQRSYMSASGYVFEYVGAGTNYGALPQFGVADPVQGKETVQLDSGKVFFTSTDQNGDFRIGPGLVISQATGVLSGRTFTKSLFANMTPFILAIEGGGGA